MQTVFKPKSLGLGLGLGLVVGVTEPSIEQIPLEKFLKDMFGITPFRTKDTQSAAHSYTSPEGGVYKCKGDESFKDSAEYVESNANNLIEPYVNWLVIFIKRRK